MTGSYFNHNPLRRAFIKAVEAHDKALRQQADGAGNLAAAKAERDAIGHQEEAAAKVRDLTIEELKKLAAELKKLARFELIKKLGSASRTDGLLFGLPGGEPEPGQPRNTRPQGQTGEGPCQVTTARDGARRGDGTHRGEGTRRRGRYSSGGPYSSRGPYPSRRGPGIGRGALAALIGGVVIVAAGALAFTLLPGRSSPSARLATVTALPSGNCLSATGVPLTLVVGDRSNVPRVQYPGYLGSLVTTAAEDGQPITLIRIDGSPKVLSLQQFSGSGYGNGPARQAAVTSYVNGVLGILTGPDLQAVTPQADVLTR